MIEYREIFNILFQIIMAQSKTFFAALFEKLKKIKEFQKSLGEYISFMFKELLIDVMELKIQHSLQLCAVICILTLLNFLKCMHFPCSKHCCHALSYL